MSVMKLGKLMLFAKDKESKCLKLFVAYTAKDHLSCQTILYHEKNQEWFFISTDNKAARTTLFIIFIILLLKTSVAPKYGIVSKSTSGT